MSIALTGVDEQHEMRWTEYADRMLLFSGVSMALLYFIERTQHWLPLNPQKFPNVAPTLAFGTAASFTTNTNWQAYSGESTMSYLTQMAGLAYHNFTSAAVGIVLAIAVIRGIARKETDKLGNFWVDTHALPAVAAAADMFGRFAGFCFSRRGSESEAIHNGATCRAANGASQRRGRQDRRRRRVTEQVIAQGPVASQEVIKKSAPTAADFSARIARIHLKIPRHSRIYFRCS